MKTAFAKFATWIKNHLPTKRRLIQIYAALLFNANIKGYISGRIYTGKAKYACVPGFNCYSCPGAIGSCPLGSLQNALNASGNRAPYYVIGIIALFGLILGRTICGYLCPVGLGQELLYKIHSPKLKKNRFTRVLSYLKYFFLSVFVIIIPIMYGQQNLAMPAFCKYVCPAGTFGGGLGLLLNPNNQDYLAMLGPIFTWKFCLLIAIMAACIFCYRAFCRFLCPLGAIYGFFNRFSFIGVHVDSDNCTDCGLCVSHCMMDIKRVGDHECINCGECISVCPTKAISFKGGKLFLRRNELDGATATPVNDLAQDAQTGSGEQTASSVETEMISLKAMAAKPSSSPAQSCETNGRATIDATKIQAQTDDAAINIQAQTSADEVAQADITANCEVDKSSMSAQAVARNPMPANRLLLEGAGVPSPLFLPDTGIPSGDSASEALQNFQGAEASEESSAAQDTNADGMGERRDSSESGKASDNIAQNEVEVSKNDASTADIANSDKTASADIKQKNDVKGEQKSTGDGKQASSGASMRERLKTAARMPKFWVQCVAVVLALALLVGVFVYFNAVVKEDIIAPTVNEVYIGEYTVNGDDISVNLTQADFGTPSAISLHSEGADLRLELTLIYEAKRDKDITLSYAATLSKSTDDAQLDGMYDGTIELVSSSAHGDHSYAENGIKLFEGESARAVLKDGLFALQLGNEGQMTTGRLIPDFDLKLYERNADGTYSYTENSFRMFDHLGEVTVINFWGTWCTPCVAELPDFVKLKELYPDIAVIAVHGISTNIPDGLTQAEFVSDFIRRAGWDKITFGQDIIEDGNCLTFKALGGKNTWPLTVIVDKTGVVRFMRQGRLGYDTLEAEATALL